LKRRRLIEPVADDVNVGVESSSSAMEKQSLKIDNNNVTGDIKWKSDRVKKDKRSSDYIYDFEEETDDTDGDDGLEDVDEDNLIILEKNHEGDEEVLQETTIISNVKRKEVEKLPIVADNSLHVPDFIIIPSVSDCRKFRNKLIPGTQRKVESLYHSFIGQLLELVFDGNGYVCCYPINSEESFKKRVLEMLIMLPLKEYVNESLQKVLKDMFCLPQLEIEKVTACFEIWLTSHPSKLPLKENLTEGTREYWGRLYNDGLGWGWLAKIAMMFSSTMSSEASVERDFSKGAWKTGDRR
jgi:hypothetical protein